MMRAVCLFACVVLASGTAAPSPPPPSPPPAPPPPSPPPCPPSPPSPPSAPPSPPVQCIQDCRRPVNGANLMEQSNCFKPSDGTCMPMQPGQPCQSDRVPCFPLTVAGGSTCVDTGKASKCAKKVSRGKCYKRRVSRICRSSCGLCSGYPPPSPSPPPTTG